MNLILGGTGRVGSAVIKSLIPEEPVVTVIRNSATSGNLKEKGINIKIADYRDGEAMKHAFKGVKTAFLITPENMRSPDIFKEHEILLQNYKNALQINQVQKIVGLSSMGAHHNQATGNLLLSHNLEKLDSQSLKTRIFLRPAYYFSNWLNYLPLVKKEKILPSFFPPDLKIPMISPKAVGEFAANLIKDKTLGSKTIELEGPKQYSTNDIATIFSEVLQQNIAVLPIPPEKWKEHLDNAGFSESAGKGLIKMTQAVIEGKTMPENNTQKAGTTFYEYLNKEIN